MTLIALGVCVVNAQEVTGNLEGTIVDQEGAVILGVTVSVTSPSLQGAKGMATNERGFFRLPGLPAGVYTVKLSHVAYQPVTFDNIRVKLGKTTTIGDVVMREDTLQMAGVVVSARRPLLDPVSTTSGGNLQRQEFELLPIDRDYKSIASLLPHANQSFLGDDINVAGSSGLENRYFINGAEVTDPVQGMGGLALPYNFIREVEVKTGGYEPEYKSSLGGIVNVITHSGGNDFSGQAFGFYTNNNFGGEQRIPASEPPEGDFSQYDVGLTLGGPIIRDALWFYGAYSPFFRNEDIQLPGLGYYPDEQRKNSFAGKLSWKASDALDVSATVLGDPSTRSGVGAGGFGFPVNSMTNPDPFLTENTGGGYGVFLEARHNTASNLFLQGSFSYTTRRNNVEARTEPGKEPLFYDFATATLSGGIVGPNRSTTDVVEGKVSGTVLAGQHEIKTGVAYREVALTSDVREYFVGMYDDTTYLTALTVRAGTIRNRVPSAYLQDSWLVNKYFRVTGGLRWDGLFLVGTDGNLVSRILGQYQPRLGIVFTPSGDDSRKVFASVGRYVEDLLTHASSMYHSKESYQLGLLFDHDPRVDPSGGDTAFLFRANIPPGVQNLDGQYYDEATLGYEQLLTDDLKMTTRGIYRRLRQIMEDMMTESGSYFGNPGVEPAAAFPLPQRDYLALELALEKTWGNRINLLASYVLSRNYGNYVGLYYQDQGAAMPNWGPGWDWSDLFDNATGLLPNDRTHVFKLNGSYRFDFGLICAASFFWESGTPLSEFSGAHAGGWFQNLVPRGTVGRLPSLWDLNLRFTYGMPFLNLGSTRPRLILDIFHVASQEQVVMQDQIRYFDTDESGTPVFPNANYGMPTKFQPPMSVRVGMEVNF